MNLEQQALKINRSKLSYRLLNLHIAWRRLFYGLYHDKTKQLVRKRNLIDHDTIQRVRDVSRVYQVLREEVKLLSGKELEQETMKEFDKLHKKENE